MTYKTHAVRMEEARASLRQHVFPRLNEKGAVALEAFLADAVLKDGQTVEDVALDVTASENITRTFKEGEVIAIAKLLESFVENRTHYLHEQAASRKAQAVQGHIDAIDAALFNGSNYTQLGRLIGALRTHVTTPDNTDISAWFKETAATHGIELAPNDATAKTVNDALDSIHQILAAPSIAAKLAERPAAERARA